MCVCMCVCVCSHHIRMCGVGQSERSDIERLIQLGLLGEQPVQPVPNISTSLQTLGVLWKLQRIKKAEITHNAIGLYCLQEKDTGPWM